MFMNEINRKILMKFLFSNSFWGVDHPLVNALKEKTISPEEFVSKIDHNDPFVITDQTHGTNTVAKLINAFDKTGIQQQLTALKRRKVHQFRVLFGLDSKQIKEKEELLKEAFPFLVPKYEELHKAVDGGCTDCRKNAISQEMLQLIRSMLPYEEAKVSKLREHLDERSIRCLLGEQVSEEELLRDVDLSPFDTMGAYPTIKRENFFDSNDCQRGDCKENCISCRTSTEHRLMLSQKYNIPIQQTITINGIELTAQLYAHPYDSINFDCPFKDDVAKKYPGLLEQFKNVTRAFFRLIGAKLAGKNVLLPQVKVSERLIVCNTCEHHDPIMGRCTVCGCFIRAKMQLTTEDCPMDKWPKLPDQ